jgi:hypothetical protein
MAIACAGEQERAAARGSLLEVVLNALIPGREELCCFPEPAYVGRRERAGRHVAASARMAERSTDHPDLPTNVAASWLTGTWR